MNVIFIYKPSKLNARHTGIRGTPSCEEIVLVLWNEYVQPWQQCSRHLVCGDVPMKMWKEACQFPIRCLLTAMKGRSVVSLKPENRLRCSETALVAFLLQKPQMKCISPYSSFVYSVTGIARYMHNTVKFRGYVHRS
jgi:hypothetical protein